MPGTCSGCGVQPHASQPRGASGESRRTLPALAACSARLRLTFLFLYFFCSFCQDRGRFIQSYLTAEQQLKAILRQHGRLQGNDENDVCRMM